MTSRLLHDLQARIASARDPVRNACLRAEHATVLARHGLLEQARAELDLIRARHAAAPHAVITAWVCLGEGLVTYYSSLSIDARDRVLRALALSEAAGAKDVGALSAAWLSQMDFAALDFNAMLRHLSLALDRSTPQEHSARSRASLVVAEAFHWADRLDLASPWYTRARHHASCEGDDSMLSALMHNMAWLQVAAYRRHELAGSLGDAETRRAKLGAESISRYDAMIGTASLLALVPMLQAQVMMLERRYGEALALMEENAEGFVKGGLQRLACTVHADIAFCRLSCGDARGAQTAADAALCAVMPATHLDDVALTHARVASIFHGLGKSDEAIQHESIAAEAWSQHKARQVALVPLLIDALRSW